MLIDWLFNIQPYFIFTLMVVVLVVVMIFVKEIWVWFKNRGQK